MVFCGMMLSSTIWGNITDTYGRKTVATEKHCEKIICAVEKTCALLFQGLLVCVAMTFYFGVLSAAAPTFFWLLVLRGLVGFGIGGVPQS